MHVGVGGDGIGTGLWIVSGRWAEQGGCVRSKVGNVEEMGWAERVESWVGGWLGGEEKIGGGGDGGSRRRKGRVSA